MRTDRENAKGHRLDGGLLLGALEDESQFAFSAQTGRGRALMGAADHQDCPEPGAKDASMGLTAVERLPDRGAAG